MSNKVGVALSNLWLAADKSATNATAYDALRQKYLDLAELTDGIVDAQTGATNERNSINTAGSIVGCVGGAILGFLGGNIIGAAAGCAAGSKAGSTVTDWAQDASFFGDTKAEAELKQLEKELKDFDVDITEDAFKYNVIATQKEEDKLRDKKRQLSDDYSTWLWQDFYGATDADYLLDLGLQAAEFGLSKVGGDLIGDFLSGSEAFTDADMLDFTNADAIGNIAGASGVDVGSLADSGLSLEGYESLVAQRNIDYLKAIEEIK